MSRHPWVGPNDETWTPDEPPTRILTADGPELRRLRHNLYDTAYETREEIDEFIDRLVAEIRDGFVPAAPVVGMVEAVASKVQERLGSATEDATEPASSLEAACSCDTAPPHASGCPAYRSFKQSEVRRAHGRDSEFEEGACTHRLVDAFAISEGPNEGEPVALWACRFCRARFYPGTRIESAAATQENRHEP